MPFFEILIDSKSNPRVQSALLLALINEWFPCLFLNKLFLCLTAKEVAQRGFGLHPGDIKNLTGHDPEQPAVPDPHLSILPLSAGLWFCSVKCPCGTALPMSHIFLTCTLKISINICWVHLFCFIFCVFLLWQIFWCL